MILVWQFYDAASTALAMKHKMRHGTKSVNNE